MSLAGYECKEEKRVLENGHRYHFNSIREKDGFFRDDKSATNYGSQHKESSKKRTGAVVY
jgi:hypothetical protein